MPSPSRSLFALVLLGGVVACGPSSGAPRRPSSRATATPVRTEGTAPSATTSSGREDLPRLPASAPSARATASSASSARAPGTDPACPHALPSNGSACALAAGTTACTYTQRATLICTCAASAWSCSELPPPPSAKSSR